MMFTRYAPAGKFVRAFGCGVARMIPGIRQVARQERI